MAGKVSKESVHYREGSPAKHCGNCSMFRPPSMCTHVDGTIEAKDVCDDWAARRRPTSKYARKP